MSEDMGEAFETQADKVKHWAYTLDGLATQFEMRDWVVNSDLGAVAAIRYDVPEDRLWDRVAASLRWLFRRRSGWEKEIGGPGRFYMALFALHRDKHLPDCRMDGGNVLVHWIETGWYLTTVQPSVGALFAEWMAAEPDNPHAAAIADEMQRLEDVQRDASRRTNPEEPS